jgi:hypothetical protein
MNKYLLASGFLLLIGLNTFLNSGKGNDELKFKVDDQENRKLQGSYDTSSVALPPAYDNVANVWEPLAPTDQPVFWYISKCGGATFSSIIAKCLAVVQCSPKGDSTGKNIPAAPPVKVITHDDDQGRYLNVNPISAHGMQTLASEDVVAKKMADIIITPRVSDAGGLMSSSSAGRFMVMMRHPVSAARLSRCEPLYLASLHFVL